MKIKKIFFLVIIIYGILIAYNRCMAASHGETCSFCKKHVTSYRETHITLIEMNASQPKELNFGWWGLTGFMNLKLYTKADRANVIKYESQGNTEGRKFLL